MYFLFCKTALFSTTSKSINHFTLLIALSILIFMKAETTTERFFFNSAYNKIVMILLSTYNGI